MNSISIANVNTKGQVVIPKEIRKKLKIDQLVPLSFELVGETILIKPIKNIITESVNEDSYLSILQGTKGTWSDSVIDGKSNIELKASERRKTEW